MASALRKESAAVYGSVAYKTGAAPERRRHRENGPSLHELPLVRPRNATQEQVQARVRVNLRPREEYSVFPAIAMACVAVMAVLIILGYSQLNSIYGQTVVARDELTSLRQEEVNLLAQYEEVFDRAALQSAVIASGADLTEARSEQKIYVDLSEPDNAVVYNEAEGGLLGGLQEIWNMLQS